MGFVVCVEIRYQKSLKFITKRIFLLPGNEIHGLFFIRLANDDSIPQPEKKESVEKAEETEPENLTKGGKKRRVKKQTKKQRELQDIKDAQALKFLQEEKYRWKTFDVPYFSLLSCLACGVQCP